MEMEHRNLREDVQKEDMLDQQLNAALPSPSPALHDNIMNRVHTTPQLSRRPYTRIAAAVAAVLCLCVIGVALIDGGFSPSYAPDMDMATDNNQALDGSEGYYAEDDGYIGKVESSDAAADEEASPSMDSPSDVEQSTSDKNFGQGEAESAPSTEAEPGSSLSSAKNPSDAPDAADAPDAPALALPEKITLRFTQNGGRWIATDGDTVYRLQFGADNTLQLYDADGNVAYGAYDGKNRVEMNATQTYRGKLTRPDTKTCILTLEAAD